MPLGTSVSLCLRGSIYFNISPPDLPNPKTYDIIFLGSGCASLSILVRIIDSGKFSDKKILLIDKDQKNKNDRTWCFWEKEAGYFESIVHKSWEQLQFMGEELNIDLDIIPYKYKMIRGIDFYKYCFDKIKTNPNITLQFGDITFPEENNYRPTINGEKLDTQNAIVFNSIYIPALNSTSRYYLKQHFKGLIIETEKPIFVPGKATLMDFRVDQTMGTTFVYVLPLSEKRALVEYTQFNKLPMNSSEYDAQLKIYIDQFLGAPVYKVIEEEMGVIPMSTETFPGYKNGIFNIGTAGGQTKASTGYTFRFIQKQSDSIVKQMLAGQPPFKKSNIPKRFLFYDNTLLHILAENKLQGKQIFTQLFKRNKASAVFKFLDNETSVMEELKIINTLPKKVFLTAGVKEIVKLF